jgi:hypothetical protein
MSICSRDRHSQAHVDQIDVLEHSLRSFQHIQTTATPSPEDAIRSASRSSWEAIRFVAGCAIDQGSTVESVVIKEEICMAPPDRHPQCRLWPEWPAKPVLSALQGICIDLRPDRAEQAESALEAFQTTRTKSALTD